MYISVDICISKTLYMYKISAHIFFKPFLIYMYKESFEKYTKRIFEKKNLRSLHCIVYLLLVFCK